MGSMSSVDFGKSIQSIPKRWRLVLLSVCTVLSFVAVLQLGNLQFSGGGTVERIYGSYAPLIWAAVQTAIGLFSFGLIALPAQTLFPADQRSPKIFNYEFWLDLIYSFQWLWLGLLSFSVAVDWLVGSIYGEHQAWIPWLATLPVWAQVLVSIWVFDFVVYWRHRCEHVFAPLWAFHAVHHTTEKVDFLTTSRLHPFEMALGAVLNAGVMRLGFDPAAVGFGFALYIKYNYFIHTNVRLKFPGFLKYVLVSPFMHHWHHAKDIAASGKNVGVVFAWNDFLFGTAHHPEHWPAEYGMSVSPQEQVGQSYVRHLLYPLQFLFARISPKSAASPTSV